jgi:transcriptional regulator with XRE-family HTH domain
VDSTDLGSLVAQRLRSLRIASGLSLDDLAARTHLGPSTISRIETGKRTISLDVLAPLAEALQTDLAALLESATDEEVVIRPVPVEAHGQLHWPLTRSPGAGGVTVAKLRMEPGRGRRELGVHPGRDWFFVLSGTVALILGDRVVEVHEGEAAEFSTMTPHRFDAVGGAAEVLTIFDREGRLAHLGTSG